MTTKTFTYYMGQFEKIWTWKDIAVDIIKLLEDSDSLIAAPELNERLQEKVQNIFIMLAQSLDQRKTAENTVKCQANFLVRLLWSSVGKRTYYTFI